MERPVRPGRTILRLVHGVLSWKAAVVVIPCSVKVKYVGCGW